MAIQTQGTIRIGDGGELQNVLGLKTVAGTSVLGVGNIPTVSAGTGISVSGTTVNNTGVLTVNGQSGNVTITQSAGYTNYAEIGSYVLGFTTTSVPEGNAFAASPSQILFPAGIKNGGPGQYYMINGAVGQKIEFGTWRCHAGLAGFDPGAEIFYISFFQRIA